MTTPASSSPAVPLDERSCPICGGLNDCAAAARGSFDGPCWCGTVVITEAQLARVPPEKRGVACICPRCAAN